MKSSIKRAAVLLAGAAMAVGLPAAADAATSTAPHSALPVAKAAKLQREAARTGHYPAGPRTSVKGLRKSVPSHGSGKARAPKGATRIRVKTAKRAFARQRRTGVKARASLFGYEGDFFAKRNSILSDVQSFYATYVPRAGGSFTAPQLFEVNDDTTITCGSRSQNFRQNALYCFPGNYVVWSIQLSQDLWGSIGDTAWATAIAHEYGHGAQNWLGYGSNGYFAYTIYREGFADCMAGAWLYSAYSRGLADNVGRGDGQEFQDLFRRVADAQTTWDNHGDFDWRYSAAIYGWNYGFNGCVSWGNWIYNH